MSISKDGKQLKLQAPARLEALFACFLGIIHAPTFVHQMGNSSSGIRMHDVMFLPTILTPRNVTTTHTRFDKRSSEIALMEEANFAQLDEASKQAVSYMHT
jgi:hypothetical protein